MSHQSIMAYRCMPRTKISDGLFSIQAVQPCHIQDIRQWRNAQMDVLRQLAIITAEEQETYYHKYIWPVMSSPQPKNILLAYMKNDNLIGYGGLVHIAWEHRRAEISFLLNSDLAGTYEDYTLHFPTFLRLMKTLAFDDLGLNRLSTETYAIRKSYISALETSGFHREGILRHNVTINLSPVDSFIHSYLRSDYRSYAESSFLGNKLNQKKAHVLVTSAAGKVPLILGVQAAARKLHPDIKVIAGDLDNNALTRHVADDFWEMPDIVDGTTDNLVAGCIERGISTIIPTRDGELLFWTQNRPCFVDAGIDVVVSPAASIQTCFDKCAFAEFGRTHGLPFISTGHHPDEFDQGRYVVKERYGAGSQKIGLDLDRGTALEFSQGLETPIYQPFIIGKEISIDAWLDRYHQVKGLVMRTRDRIIDGESQVTTTFRNAEIETMVMQILHALKLRGPVVMQAIIDVKNNIHIIECNTRFGGASTTSIAAGLDMFYWSLLESSGVDVSGYPFNRIPDEVRQIRIPSDIYIYGNNF